MAERDAAVHEIISPLEAVQVWRQQLIQDIVRALAIPGFLASAVGSYIDYLYRHGRTIPFYVGAYAVFILVWVVLWRRTSYVFRAGVILVLIYGLGVVDLFNSGLSGDSEILFLAFSAMTTLLLGRRWGILALALCVVTMVAFGGAYSAGLLAIPVEKLVHDNTALSSWLNSAVALLMLSALLVLSQNYLMRRLLTAFTRSRDLTRELETDIAKRVQAEKEREKLIHELEDALARVKTLSGFLPICANCKKIRDDQGEWHELEVYVRDHSNADFSHGICPECAEKLYPGFFK
jgi:hypothetical protein